jgi:small subunit ribosomal protein S20
MVGGTNLANIKSQIKENRQIEKHRVRNRVVRTSTRTYVKKALAQVAEGASPETTEAVKIALSALDRAAQKGIIHPNNAARRKSRLMKRLNALQS